MTSVKICNHEKYKIAEKEFYVNQKNKFSGTRIICKKCGKSTFIKDKKD
jgi:ribosomal protein S27AE